MSKMGGAKRHRKILRDNIAGITRPALLRILHRAGVKRVSGLVYEELRGVMKVFLEKVIRDMVVFTAHARRKTVMLEDLEAGLKINGIILAAGLNENASRTASLQSCNARGKKGGAKKEENEENADEKKAKKKAHRFRPGTVALREIRKQQNASDKLVIPKSNFERLMREVAQDFQEDLRFSAGVSDLLQLTTEDYLTNLCHGANLCAIHAGRETLQPKDIQLVRHIRNESF